MIRAVIFDCFGVLYLESYPGSVQPLTKSDNRELRDLAGEGEYGLIDAQTLQSGFAKLLGTTPDQVAHRLDGFFRNDQLLSYAQQLRSSYKIGLLSNIGPDTMQRFFPGDQRHNFFDVAVISSEVGMVKPHLEIFEYTCRQLGVDTSEAVMVDDMPDNCDGAREAGLRAIHFESNDQVIAELDRLLKVQ